MTCGVCSVAVKGGEIALLKILINKGFPDIAFFVQLFLRITTTIGRCPIRSCEATFDRLMMKHWLKPDKGFKPDMDFSDIDKLTCDLIIDEENKKGTKKLLLDPYV